VSERKDVLSGLFFMLTLWAYAGYARRPFALGRYLTVVLLFALGLMAKPMLVTLPFVLLLLDYWPLGRIGPYAAGISRRVVVEKLPLLALTAASCGVTVIAQGKVSAIEVIPLASRIANALVSYVAYIRDLFYPAGLAVLYPYPESGLPIWKVAASSLAMAGLSTAALVWRRRFPYLFVGWFWYVGMLIPVIGLVRVGLQSMADRYTYLPQIGLCIAVAWGAAQLAFSRRHHFRAYGAAAALVLLILGGLAWRQTSYWRDTETLWTRTIACTTGNFLPHNDLGLILGQQGRIDEAIAHFQKALEIKPSYANAHQNLGVALDKRGQLDAAIVHYRKALELKPDYPGITHNNLGSALARQGQLDAAIAHFQKALELRPDYPEARNNLDLALRMRGKPD
jgi:tetratricopeptide (TPR) repeat protein